MKTRRQWTTHSQYTVSMMSTRLRDFHSYKTAHAQTVRGLRTLSDAWKKKTGVKKATAGNCKVTGRKRGTRLNSTHILDINHWTNFWKLSACCSAMVDFRSRQRGRKGCALVFASGNSFATERMALNFALILLFFVRRIVCPRCTL